MTKVITTTNNRAEYGVVYKIRGCLGEIFFLTLNKENGDLYYINREIINKLKHMTLSDVLNELCKSLHDTDYNKVMQVHLILKR